MKLLFPADPDHHIEEFRLPDLESTFQLYGAHWRSVEPHWTYPRHDHPLFEINLVLEGEQRMMLNGKLFIQQPGDLLLIQPRVTHSSSVGANHVMSYFCLHFDIDDPWFRQLLCSSDRSLYSADSAVALKIRPALDKLLALCERKHPFTIADRMQTLSAAFELCSQLGDALSQSADGLLSHSQHSLQIAGKIAEYIEQAAGDALAQELAQEQEHDFTGIREIARALGYSSSYCNRVFHQVYGMSPRQYMSSLKLRQAKQLLLDHTLTVEQIAIRLGYKDTAHFSRQFKRWTNLSPREFRQMRGEF